MRIPEKGWKRDEIFARLERYRENDTLWREGRTWASINPGSVHWVEPMLADLATSVEAARALPSGALAEQIQQAFGHLQPQDLDEEVFRGMLATAGIDGTSLPGRMAEINEVNALPVPLRERLLVEYLNELYRRPEAS